MKTDSMRVAVIGTAGRDKGQPMSKALWHWMLKDVKERVHHGDHLVSGGAAWADHLAVNLYLSGYVQNLTLHLPCRFKGGRFIGPLRSSASAADYYHQRFSMVLDLDTRAEIAEAIEKGASVTFEPSLNGYIGMFARNAKVATAEAVLAYTFGQGSTPEDGGTKDTWDKCKGVKVHIPLPKNLKD